MYKLLITVIFSLVLLIVMYPANDKRTVAGDDHQLSKKEFAVLKVRATAYSNDPISINVEKWRDGKTATMTTARWGVVATDPKVIPLGSRIFIEDMGWFSAEDTGGRIKGNRIDIFYPSRAEALQFGKKELIVLIEKINDNS